MPLGTPGEFVVLRGVPGSGKTTWRRSRSSPVDVVCLDDIRALICGQPHNQMFNDTAVRIQNDALLTLADRHAMFTVAVVFDTPPDVARLRNTARPHPVPDHVMDKMIAAWAKSVPATGPIGGFAVTRRVLGPQPDRTYGPIPAEYAKALWLT